MEDRSKGVSEDRLRARKSGGLCLWATLRLQRDVRDRKQNLPNTDALNECWMLWNAMKPAPSKGLPYVYVRCDACGGNPIRVLRVLMYKERPKTHFPEKEIGESLMENRTLQKIGFLHERTRTSRRT